MAPSPSSSGISRSIVTRSGCSWCTLRNASKPSRAVATTRNGPSPREPPSTSVSTRRIKALSSTTSTVAWRSEDDVVPPHDAGFDATIVRREADGAAPLSAHGLAHHGNPDLAQRCPGSDDVALPHLHRSGRHELREHAGAARQLGDQPVAGGAQLQQALDQEGNRRRR